MWQCTKCNHKNNKSSEKCHGLDCKATKQHDGIIELRELPKKQKKVKAVLDYCESCKKDMLFTPTKWKGKTGYWACESHSHRPAELLGRPKAISSYLPKVNL